MIKHLVQERHLAILDLQPLVAGAVQVVIERMDAELVQALLIASLPLKLPQHSDGFLEG
jgi:hypothetical protein